VSAIKFSPSYSVNIFLEQAACGLDSISSGVLGC
jgi:hypothetical protein